MTDRLVATASRLLERRTSRRGVLIRIAIGGSALAVAPLRYLLRPGSAMAVITCRNCHPGALCCDGWTEFCCTINGGVNTLPAVHVHGRLVEVHELHAARSCARPQGVRYYVDCNRLPGPHAARTAARAPRARAATARPAATSSATASATPTCTR